MPLEIGSVFAKELLMEDKEGYSHLPAQIDCQKLSRVSPSPGSLHDRPVMAMESYSAIFGRYLDRTNTRTARLTGLLSGRVHSAVKSIGL